MTTATFSAPAFGSASTAIASPCSFGFLMWRRRRQAQLRKRQALPVLWFVGWGVQSSISPPATRPGATVCVGGYLLGAEDDPFLWGHPDIRY